MYNEYRKLKKGSLKMKVVKLKSIKRQYKNNGQHAEQLADYALTGQIRKADRIAFDKGSDIPELEASVKSARFTLASTLEGETFKEQLEDYFTRTASKLAIYVSLELETAFLMNMEEFRTFIETFCKLQRSSSKNGGKPVIRMGTETKKVQEWLLERA
jgi:hypothetical protein